MTIKRFEERGVMQLSQERNEQEQFAANLLTLAGIPVPEAEIVKLSHMYRAAEKARQTLRSARLGETEPIIVFAAETEDGHE